MSEDTRRTASIQRGELVVTNLTAALIGAYDHYNEFEGANLPELLASAMRAAQAQIVADGGACLSEHRPGSWEASHVDALATGWDWDEVSR